MKLIKLLSFLLILTSCDQYFGIIEPDYIPTNETKEVFGKNITIQKNNDISELDKIIYPFTNFLINENTSIKIKKITSLNENSSVNIQKDLIFYSKNDFLSQYNVNKPREKLNIKIDLDQDENIIQIINLSSSILVLTNKSKIFSIEENSAKLKANFDTFINKKIILKDNKLITFTAFGDAIEIDLLTYTPNFKGNFSLNHGILESSRNYKYENLISHLYNSGTLIFLNELDLKVEPTFFIQDLNILSTVGNFEEFIDAPFVYKDYLYFIEKSGLVSVFNPFTSEILWEVDIGRSIKDFNFTEEGKLILLTNYELIIFDSLGEMILNFKHINDYPQKMIGYKNNILIFGKEEINVVDLKSKSTQNIKNKFNGDIEFISFNSNIFIKDRKNLYQISE
jgi:hypothetical protein